MENSIVFRAKDLLSGALTKITSRIATMGMTSKSTGGILRRSFTGMERSISRATSRIFSLRAALASLAAGFIFASVIRTAAAFEKLDIQLTNLQGSAAKGKEALDWIKEFTIKTPLTLEEVTQAFVKMRAFGMDPMNGSMQAIVDQTAKLSGGQKELQSIILAVGQMWTEQKVRGQEVRQLIQQAVPVYQLLADANGKTAQQMKAMGEAGLLGGRAVRQLISEMGKAASGSALIQMTTFTGLWSNFVNEISLSKNEFAKADRGLFALAKGGLTLGIEKLTQFRKTGQLEEWGKNIGDVMLRATKSIILGTSSILSALQPIFSVVTRGINNIIAIFNSLPDWAKPLGLIGAIMLGPKGLAVGVLILGIVDPIANGIKRIIRTFKGELGTVFDPKPIESTKLALIDLAENSEAPLSGLAQTLIEIEKAFERINAQGPVEPPIKPLPKKERFLAFADKSLGNDPFDVNEGFGGIRARLTSEQATLAGQILDTNEKLTQSYRDQFTALGVLGGGMGSVIARQQQQNIAMQAGLDLRQAANGALQQYILGQQKLGPALRAASAQVLAGIAAESAILAIFSFAKGLYLLATTYGVPNPGSIAAFSSAAQYAALAGGAGVSASALSSGTSASRAPVQVANSPGAASIGPGQQNQSITARITIISPDAKTFLDNAREVKQEFASMLADTVGNNGGDGEFSFVVERN